MSRTYAAVDVPLSQGRGYHIAIGSGLLASVPGLGEFAGRRIVVVTQPKIEAAWGKSLETGLRQAGFAADSMVVTFPSGERYKTMGTITTLYDALYALTPAIDRKTVVVALGGGVVGDMAGYVAATYLRGLDYVQIPTTLLAMVDSSVGGKTGFDFRAGKNLIGAFHQPRAVVIDTDTLATLPPREFRSGMAEVVKYGVIADRALLREVTERPWRALRADAGALSRIIARCCEIKAQVVVEDEFEQTGQRATLNFGHTIGHALEAATRYRRYKHGEAIAIGMVAAACIGEEAGVTPSGTLPAILAALRAQGLPTAIPADVTQDEILSLLGRDKKARDGNARFVLARQVGVVETDQTVAAATVRRGLERAYSKTDSKTDSETDSETDGKK